METPVQTPETTPKVPFTYWRLFTAMLLLSAFTFGGGYVIVSMMRKKFADAYGWVSEEEVYDLIAVAQASPGPLAVNMSILMGYRLGGFAGFLCSLCGTVLPPLVTLSIISLAYEAFRTNPLIGAMLRTMQAGVAAIITDVVLTMGARVVKEKSVLSILLMAAAFVATYVFGVNVAFIILACALIGVLRTLWADRRAKA